MDLVQQQLLDVGAQSFSHQTHTVNVFPDACLLLHFGGAAKDVPSTKGKVSQPKHGQIRSHSGVGSLGAPPNVVGIRIPDKKQTHPQPRVTAQDVFVHDAAMWVHPEVQPSVQCRAARPAVGSALQGTWSIKAMSMKVGVGNGYMKPNSYDVDVVIGTSYMVTGGRCRPQER